MTTVYEEFTIFNTRSDELSPVGYKASIHVKYIISLI